MKCTCAKDVCTLDCQVYEQIKEPSFDISLRGLFKDFAYPLAFLLFGCVFFFSPFISQCLCFTIHLHTSAHHAFYCRAVQIIDMNIQCGFKQLLSFVSRFQFTVYIYVCGSVCYVRPFHMALNKLHFIHVPCRVCSDAHDFRGRRFSLK